MAFNAPSHANPALLLASVGSGSCRRPCWGGTPLRGSLRKGKAWPAPGPEPEGHVWANGCWPQEPSPVSLLWTLVRASQVAWAINVVPFPKPRGAHPGRTDEHGPRPVMLSLPADQNLPGIVPEAWRPQLLPCPPTPSGSVRRSGRIHSEFLPGARETVHTAPARRPGASWPLPLAEAAVGTCPLAHHGLPPKAPQRNREWPREEQGCGNGLRFRFRTVMLWARAPPPSRGWAGAGLTTHP